MRVQDWLGEKNDIGIDIWENKYQNDGETFDEWLDRVSGGNKEIRQLIVDKKFLFGGRILANRGIAGNKTYSNCYVLSPPEDNLESIFDTAKKLARTFSYGGGVGFDLGNLAPKGAKVNNTAKKSTGAVSFSELFNTTTGLIGQNGRRGALMLSMPVNHPDIEEFIELKGDVNKITNANISVRVDDEFMTSVLHDTDYKLSFTRKETGEVIEKNVSAKSLFRKLCEMNWKCAEPGILFWDEIQGHNMMGKDSTFTLAGVNPCGEEPLPAGGSCLLGAINLSVFVVNPFTDSAHFDSESFTEAVKTSVVALNEVLDEGLILHPLAEQRIAVKKWRQIGLGIMGLADCLIKLGLVYGSEEANHFCKGLSLIMFRTALLASDELGGKIGCYEGYDPNVVNESDLVKRCGVVTTHLANSQLLTVAPTGTISTMLGVSGGIEPMFATKYTRKTQSLHGEDVTYEINTPIVQQYLTLDSVDHITALPPEFITAREIKPINRLKCQAAWQSFIDASISSTINLPNSATIEDIERIYIDAWSLNLKGVTVYREGCDREGILTTGDKEEVVESTKTNGLERHLTTGCGSLHVCAFFDDKGNLKNTYLSKGSDGGCSNYMIGLSRMMSLAARNGVDIESIVDQLDSCGTCPSYAVRRATKKDTSKGSCCPMAIGKALMEMQKEIKNTTIENSLTSNENMSVEFKNTCPECGNAIVFEGGCCSCKNCGWSKCG